MLPEWRNWQTQWIQNPPLPSRSMWVQLPPPALLTEERTLRFFWDFAPKEWVVRSRRAVTLLSELSRSSSFDLSRSGRPCRYPPRSTPHSPRACPVPTAPAKLQHLRGAWRKYASVVLTKSRKELWGVPMAMPSGLSAPLGRTGVSVPRSRCILYSTGH